MNSNNKISAIIQRGYFRAETMLQLIISLIYLLIIEKLSMGFYKPIALGVSIAILLVLLLKSRKNMGYTIGYSIFIMLQKDLRNYQQKGEYYEVITYEELAEIIDYTFNHKYYIKEKSRKLKKGEMNEEKETLYEVKKRRKSR